MYKVMFRLDADGCWYLHELTLIDYELKRFFFLLKGKVKIFSIKKSVYEYCCNDFKTCVRTNRQKWVEIDIDEEFPDLHCAT